jgi:hypothetical protein
MLATHIRELKALKALNLQNSDTPLPCFLTRSLTHALTHSTFSLSHIKWTAGSELSRANNSIIFLKRPLLQAPLVPYIIQYTYSVINILS